MATFISLFLMNSAQPALLYLVPFTLIPIILTALARGELQSMWDGDLQVSAFLTCLSVCFFLYIFVLNSPFH